MLSQIFIAIPAFLLAITLLVAVHEYGHFWVARKLGVKVLSFSIGFGKPIWRKTPKGSETEYLISALPIGGYVKMLDERVEENVDPVDLPRAFNRQPVWKRILILLAGPAANFIFAIGLFYFLFLYGVQDYKTFVQATNNQSMAIEAGLKAGDEVIAINGKKVDAFEEMLIGLIDGVISSDKLQLEVRREQQIFEVTLIVDPEVAKLKDPRDLLKGLGIQAWRPNYSPIVGAVSPGATAEQAGLQKGDMILQVDSIIQTSIEEFISYIQQRPLQTVELLISRDDSEFKIPLNIGEKLINERKIGIIGSTLRVPQDLIESLQVRRRFGLVDSFTEACASTYAMSALSLKMFKEMLKGNVSVKNLSGPLSIAEQASYSAQSGFDQFIKFLALISIALGIVNLLPVPMLDGGQIMFNIMELVKGSPVSQRTEMVFQQLGVLCIFLIMGLAIFNDIERLLF